jgi:large exoprotein involved in heme utilization and adhesion
LSDFARNGVISTITYNSGSAGNINIFSKRLVIDKNAQINSSSRSDGKGGNITVNSSDLINITGVNGSRIGTGIFSPTLAGGSGGNISIETLGDLILSGSNAGVFSGGVAGIIRGGTPTSIPSPVGAGGNIRVIAANSVQLDGGSLGANNFNGKAGNIDINTNFLNIYNGFIQVNSVFQQAGNIKINANSLDLKNGSILANTGIDGANINLTILDTLKLSNESLISANASKNANGGNITIDTSILLAIPPTGPNGSDIRANADFGKGGNIVINSQGVFGTAQRKARDGNQTNDIDASSQFGQSGQVQINTTTDPSQGIVELPATVVDPTTLVAQNPCRQASSSEFTRSGRGGLPPSLSQDLSGESTQVGLVEPANLSAAKPEAPPTSTQVSLLPLSSSQIAPAKGWVYNDKGEVVLVAYNSAVTGPQRLQSDSKGCPVF